MAEGVEVYLRPSGDRVLLNIYVPKSLTAHFVDSLREGSFSDADVPIGFEMSVQSKWYTGIGEDHLRVPISVINVVQSD